MVFGVWLREGRFRGGSRWVSVVPFWGWIGVLRGERVGCGGLYRRRGWAPSAVARSTARPLWGGRGGRTRTILGDQRLTYPESATPRRAPPLLRGIQLGCSSSVRAWSIWSLGVRRHGGRGHRLTLAGERFVGLASEDAAAFSIFFPMDQGSSVVGANGGNTGPPTAAGGGAGTGIPSPGRTGALENPAGSI